MSDEQIVLTLKEAAEQLFRLRLQAQTERLDAPSELRKQRRRSPGARRSSASAAAAAQAAASRPQAGASQAEHSQDR